VYVCVYIINFEGAFKNPDIKFSNTSAGLRSQFPFPDGRPIFKGPVYTLKSMSVYTHTHTHTHMHTHTYTHGHIQRQFSEAPFHIYHQEKS